MLRAAAASSLITERPLVPIMNVDADVAIDTVRGPALTAQVYRGDIDGLRVSSRQIRMTAIEGDIHLDAEPQTGGSLVVSSLRGNVDVTLRGAIGTAVRARAGGRLTLPDGPTAAADRGIEA